MRNNDTKETKEQQPRTGNFDDKADEYDAKAESIWKFHHDVVKILQPAMAADQTLLEFGCGTGNICLSLCPRLQYVYGIDISANMLAKAREKILQRNLTERATVRELDLTARGQMSAIGFPERYDWIVCSMALHHVPNPMEKIELLTGLLREEPKGKLVIVEFATTAAHDHHHLHHHGHDNKHQRDQKKEQNKHCKDNHRHHDHHQRKQHHHEHERERQHHDHDHHHHKHEYAAAANLDDPPTTTSSSKEALKHQHGIFSDGFNPQSMQETLKTLGLDKFAVSELPPMEGMDKEHPFYGLAIALMIASKS